MFESIGRSFALVTTSWHILMDEKKLLVFPLLSGIVLLVVILTFALPLLLTGSFMSMTALGPLLFYGLLFFFYAVSYCVVIFFNTALITCVNAYLQGKEATIGEGLSSAMRHLPSILAWALISATVGILLHLIEERAGFIGDLASTVIGGVWSLVTFFVVPVLVLEDKGITDAVKDSVTLIKKTWGESIIGGGSIFLVFVAIGIAAVLGVLATLLLGSAIIFGTALVLFLVLIVILAVVASAMQGIFVTALYTYARTGTIPAGFDKDLIRHAFVPKPARQGNI